MNIFIIYSPVILIATYTNLLLSTLNPATRYIAANAAPWAGFRLWRWINTYATLGLYTLEISYGGDMDLVEADGQGITGHWKVE